MRCPELSSHLFVVFGIGYAPGWEYPNPFINTDAQEVAAIPLWSMVKRGRQLPDVLEALRAAGGPQVGEVTVVLFTTGTSPSLP